MSLDALLNHKCNIYHLQSVEKQVGYGLPVTKEFKYSDEPDCTDVKCHFCTADTGLSLQTAHAYNAVSASVKLVLPVSTDVRINDKIVDTETGYEYTAEVPRNIRNHHIFVMLTRREEQKKI